MPVGDKIKKLQDLAAKYESKEFLKFIAGTLLHLGNRENSPFFKNLLSPMRQLFYLGYLNLKAAVSGEETKFSEQQWNEMTLLLHEIEIEYFHLLGFPKDGKETKEEMEKIGVTMPTFMNYYFNGALSYQEQEIERIEEIFKSFDSTILSAFDVGLSDFIAFYDQVDELLNTNLNTTIKFLNLKKWQEFTKQCIEKGLVNPKDWISEAPEEIAAYKELIKNPGSFLVVNIHKIDDARISVQKFKTIFSLFSYAAPRSPDIVYYTDDNELLSKPFLKINEDNYLVFYHKQFLRACYKLLFDKCLSINSDKILKTKDRFVEAKTESIFRELFPRDAFFYSNYSIDNGKSEQDILILYKRLALIIEVKAVSYRAPMRDHVKAFDKLKSDFKNCIQYGYDQTSRVAKAFRSDNIKIMDMKKTVLYEFNPNKYNVFSIVVTFERFGHIQTNLHEMLSIREADEYPWCVNIDDLEAFILTLKKKNNRIQAFVNFLEYRQYFHGHLFCADELELCGQFLKDNNRFKELSQTDEVVVTTADLTKPIEDSYRAGMGFKNERHIKAKKDKTAGFL